MPPRKHSAEKLTPANRVGEPSAFPGFLKSLPPFTFMPDNTNQPITDTGEPGMNEVLARNIRTLLEKRRAEERKASIEQKVADAITRFTGSMPFVYLHAVFFGLWILIILRWLVGSA